MPGDIADPDIREKLLRLKDWPLLLGLLDSAISLGWSRVQLLQYNLI